MKKKRIAIVKKQNVDKVSSETRQSLLGFIYSVGQNRSSNESKLTFSAPSAFIYLKNMIL